MSKEQHFLIKYGIHNFVKIVMNGSRKTFVINQKERETMIDHAKKLIKGGYGERVEIHVA